MQLIPRKCKLQNLSRQLTDTLTPRSCMPLLQTMVKILRFVPLNSFHFSQGKGLSPSKHQAILAFFLQSFVKLYPPLLDYLRFNSKGIPRNFVVRQKNYTVMAHRT
ncbi:hypothetical protein Acr_07g0012620 [Actinidia rufa]|uniref:Uncharacterized protein n=1 Tax=Actinidia rufa TaxID=165716 RepID=A0A7J0EY09_9ERIC|nr:hypothetical protein Acr_07g0012620 [Actinidia rufa]